MKRIRHLILVLPLAIGLAACEDSVDLLGPLDSPDAGLVGDSLDTMLEQASSGALAGEDATQEPQEAGQEERETGTASPSAGVALFDRLAEEIPGFGGLYRTRQCAVVIVLTSAGDRAQAIAVVRRKVVPLMARPCAESVSIRTQAGEFTYLELKRFLHAARPLTRMEGVHSMRIDFQLNRLVIEVASRRVANWVLERLPEIGIPRAAVVFRAATRS